MAREKIEDVEKCGMVWLEMRQGGLEWADTVIRQVDIITSLHLSRPRTGRPCEDSGRKRPSLTCRDWTGWPRLIPEWRWGVVQVQVQSAWGDSIGVMMCPVITAAPYLIIVETKNPSRGEVDI